MKKVIFVGAGEYAESVYDSMATETVLTTQ